MISVIAVQGPNQANVIHAGAHLWKQVTNFRSAFAAGPELPVGPFQITRFQLGSVLGKKIRLRIEGIHVRNTSAHVEENHALGFGAMMRRLWRERILWREYWPNGLGIRQQIDQNARKQD
jgi:hypothetical protein